MKKIQTIILLAAGDGDRFWPLREKMHTNVLGRPFLEYIYSSIKPFAERVVVVANESNLEMVKKIVGDDADIAVQKGPTIGMAGAALACKGLVSGEALILGNDLFDFAKIQEMGQRDEDLVLFAKKVQSYFPGGYLKLDNGRVVAIVEKPDPDRVPSDLVRLVVDYFKHFEEFVSVIESQNDTSDYAYEQALTHLITNKRATYIEYTGEWLTLKFPWHLLSIMSHRLSSITKQQIDPSVVVSKSAMIVGPVIIDKNVKIGDFVKISGPCYIGEGTIIADYSLVRESHIGKNCLIGSTSEVARSYLGDDVSLHRNYVGDSVLADGVLFGAGAVTANFRFDKQPIPSYVKGNKVETGRQKLGSIIGKGTKIGVNSTVFPGVKIGENCIIRPSHSIARDMHDNTVIQRTSV